jgi:hypothetical protein
MVAGTILNGLGPGIHAPHTLIKRKKMGGYNIIDILDRV